MTSSSFVSPPRSPHQFPMDQFVSSCVFLRPACLLQYSFAPHHKCPKSGHYGRVVFPKLVEAAGNARGVPNGASSVEHSYCKQCRERFYSPNRPRNATNDFSTEIDGNAQFLLVTTWIDGHIHGMQAYFWTSLGHLPPGLFATRTFATRLLPTQDICHPDVYHLDFCHPRTFANIGHLPPGQLPPGSSPHRTFSTRTFATLGHLPPGLLPPQDICQHRIHFITGKEDVWTCLAARCHPDHRHIGHFPPGLLPPQDMFTTRTFATLGHLPTQDPFHNGKRGCLDVSSGEIGARALGLSSSGVVPLSRRQTRPNILFP